MPGMMRWDIRPRCRWLPCTHRADVVIAKRKPENIIMAGLSTQLYANLGGLVAGLVAFVLVAVSYFLFTQPFKLSMSMVVPFALVNIFLAVYLLIMIYYNSEFQTKVQV